MQARWCLGLVGALLVALPHRGVAASGERVPVRLGWQVPAATQAQIVEVLKRTDVLEVHGLEPRLVPFSFGTPQVEAALAGDLDVVFAGDQPVINLIARGGRWRIVSRLFIDRIAVMVPPGSPVTDVAGLAGQVVASPFGSVGHRELILQEEAAGLDPRAEVDNRDLDILEIRRRVQAEDWGALDAVTVWEPTASYFEGRGLATVVAETRTLGVVAISEQFIAEHPQAAVQLLVGLARAWHFLASQSGRVRQWYLDDAQLGYTVAALRDAASVDPNFRASSPESVTLRLTEADLEGLEEGARWAREWGYARGAFEVDQAVDRALLEQALAIVARDRFEPIQVLLPSAREAPDTGSHPYLFDRLPLWTIFGLLVALSIGAIETGHRVGRWRRRHEHEAEGPIGTVVGAVLALLAFVIALTFSAAGSRFDARKEALLNEVNALGTAYLRADLLPEPHRTTARSLLRDYVEIRLGMYRAYGRPDALRTIQGRTAALQETLWTHAQALAEADRRSETYALFTAALNEVFDLNTRRVVLGAEYRTPLFVWVALVLVSALAMVAVGFQFGIRGSRSVTATLALSLTFALVIQLVFDLDRPGEGLIEVNQQPMIELYQSLGRQ